MQSNSLSRSSSCHVLTALGTYVIALACLYFIGADEEQRISATIGLGFGQISMIAIWFMVGVSLARLLSAAVAVFGCYLAMALWVAVQDSHVDGVFYGSLAISNVVYFIAMAAGMLVIRKLRGVRIVRLADTQVSDELSSQYGIRDIMIVMSVVALAAAAVKVVGEQGNAYLSQMLIVFGLIALSFFLMSWPVVVACLSERWLQLAVFSGLMVVAIFFAQSPVFTSVLGPGWARGFFLFLDTPFVLAVAVHSLIARGFGYRLKAVGHSCRE